MLEDFNFPFHGVLLNPLIKYSCGPLIKCDFCSTFDEASPFLVFPSSNTFTIESFHKNNIFIHLQLSNGMIDKEYPMKMHFFTFGSSFVFFVC